MNLHEECIFNCNAVRINMKIHVGQLARDDFFPFFRYYLLAFPTVTKSSGSCGMASSGFSGCLQPQQVDIVRSQNRRFSIETVSNGGFSRSWQIDWWLFRMALLWELCLSFSDFCWRFCFPLVDGLKVPPKVYQRIVFQPKADKISGIMFMKSIIRK